MYYTPTPTPKKHLLTLDGDIVVPNIALKFEMRDILKYTVRKPNIYTV